MNFIGHQKNLEYLNKVLEKGKISHAYFFSGSEAVGKFTLAKAFALALIGGKEKIDFEALEIFEKNNARYPDLNLIRPPIEEKKGIIKEREIKSEIIREALRELQNYPYAGKKRILIINNAHRMNKTAQNVILKTLEEPNSTALIILVTHQEGEMISTIKSRCQKINFSLVRKEVLKEDFEGKGRELLGRPGLALRPVADFSDEWKTAGKILGSDISIAEKLKQAEILAQDTGRSRKILELTIWLLREQMQEEASDNRLKILAEKIESVENCLSELGTTNANARLTIEKTLLNL
jgi:DNA polymerase III delta prime subunit